MGLTLEQKKDLALKKQLGLLTVSDKKSLAVEKMSAQPKERGVLETIGRGAIESLPAVGATLGGIAGTAAGPGGTIIGAGAGAVAGKGLQQQARSVFFPEEAPQTTEQALTEQAGAGVREGLGQLAGGVAAKALGAGAKALFPAAKKGAQKTIEAANRLGIKATKGQVTQGKIVQGLESSLEQSPTITGAVHRRARGKIEDALTRRLEKIAGKGAGGLTKFEVGEGVKASIKEKASGQLSEARALYKGLEDKFAASPVSPNLLGRVRQGLLDSKAIKLQPNSPAAKLANELGESVKNIKTVEDLKEFRTILGGRYEANMDKATRKVVDDAYDMLTDIRSKSLIFDKESGEQIAKADKIWKNFFKEFKELDASFGGKPSKSPQQFLTKLEKLEGSDVSPKLFQAQKVGRLGKLKEALPSEFKALSEQRIGEIVEKSQVKGELNSRKFIRNIAKLPPETKRLMFGDDGIRAIDDVETIINAFPDKMGPSGTPQGIDFLSPTGFLKEIRDIARLARKKVIPSGLSKAEQDKVVTAIESLTKAAGLTAADLKGKKSKPIERRLRGK